MVFEMSQACALGAINHERDVVIDDTNLGRTTRIKWVETFKRMGYKVRYAVFNTPPGICKRRREDDGKGFDGPYWTKVIDSMITMYQQPSLDEGADEIITIS